MLPAKILSDLITSATSAKAHFEVWWAQASEARPQFDYIVNNHSDFFHASRDAHYTAFFVYLAHLFDKRANSSSIPTYLLSIKPIAEATTYQNIQRKYASLELRARPLLTARHKTVAHVDALLTEKDVFAPMNTTWNEVRELVYDSAMFVAELAGTTDLGSIGICRDRRHIESTLRLIRTLKNNSETE